VINACGFGLWLVTRVATACETTNKQVAAAEIDETRKLKIKRAKGLIDKRYLPSWCKTAPAKTSCARSSVSKLLCERNGESLTSVEVV
jgi:hypothetical protein